MTEPYVVASDVYSTAGHVGRGGWTWYTGAAGWLYRCITESLLGLAVDGTTLTVRPCVPASWTSYRMTYRHRSASYDIAVELVQAGAADIGTWVDGVACADAVVTMVDDGQRHAVLVRTSAVPR
jgi:cyclic beta-1,2-glucan synthetase